MNYSDLGTLMDVQDRIQMKTHRCIYIYIDTHATDCSYLCGVCVSVFIEFVRQTSFLSSSFPRSSSLLCGSLHTKTH